MGRETVLFSSEERMSRAAAAAFLRQLAERLEANAVVLKQGGRELALSLPEQVVLELKVESEGGKGRAKRSLEIELEWVEGETAGGVQLG